MHYPENTHHSSSMLAVPINYLAYHHFKPTHHYLKTTQIEAAIISAKYGVQYFY